MATIPTGNFGFAAPELRRSQTVSTVVEDNSAALSAKMLGNAVQDLTAQFSAGIKEQAELEARKKRNKAATLVNEYETKLQTAELALERQHAEGTIGSDALLPAWEDSAKKLREEIAPFANELDDDTRAEFMSTLEGTRVNGLARFQGSALNAAKKDHQASVSETYESMRKLNLGNPKVMDAWLDGEGGEEYKRAFGADAPEMIRKAKEQANRDAITIAITNAGDNPAALSKVLQQLDSKESMQRLDPDYLLQQKSALSSTINTINDRAEYKAQVAMDKRERQAEVKVKSFFDHTTNGGIASPEMVQDIVDTTKGTAYEGAADLYLKRQDEVQGLLKAPEDQQRAWLASTRSRMNEQGSTPDEMKFVDNMEQQINKRADMRKKNPLEAAEIESGARPTTVDWSQPNPDDVEERIASRDVVMKKTGKDPGVLKQQEVDQIAATIESGAPDKAVSELKNLSASLGGDKELYNSAMQQLNAKSTTYALAGKFAEAGRDRDAITLIEGKRVIDEKQTTLPSIEKFRQSVMGEVGAAFKNNPAAANAAVENAYAAYASMVARDGVTNANISGKQKTEAVKMVIGETVNMGDNKIVVPHGRKATEHKDAVLRGYANATAEYGGKVNATDLQFVQRSGGKYQLFDGREPLLDPSGKPLMVTPIYE